MEAFAVVATVASIVQLSQAALTLSKTLYDVSSSISSAKEDINNLADDLQTFSQSLSLLSRLLDDSKAWYSDDVYLLTAKIIRDCANLYGKIDKVLIKAGGNGKGGWKDRVKFVYKESQIKRLMERLRDMKSTLTTILMSLQVDLQLSLLNISSASKLQRTQATPLRSETIQALKGANESAEVGGFLPHYCAELADSCVQNILQAQKVEPEQFPEVNSNIEKSFALKSADMDHQGTLSVLSTSKTGKHNAESSIEKLGNSFATETVPKDEFFQGVSHEVPTDDISIAKSLKSSSSTQSFATFVSAISMQPKPNTNELQMTNIKSVIHAFEVALEALKSLVDKRHPEKVLATYPAAKDLKTSLENGSIHIEQRNELYNTRYGDIYIQAFKVPDIIELENLSTSIMVNIVMPLHVYSASHQKLSNVLFEDLDNCTKRNIQQILEIINGSSNLAALELIPKTSSAVTWKLTKKLKEKQPNSPGSQTSNESYRYGFNSVGGRRMLCSTTSHPITHLYIAGEEENASNQKAMVILSAARARFASMLQSGTVPTEPQRVKMFEDMYNCPELSLPFIGYTFKRFEQVTNNYRSSGHISSRASIGSPKDSDTEDFTLGKAAGEIELAIQSSLHMELDGFESTPQTLSQIGEDVDNNSTVVVIPKEDIIDHLAASITFPLGGMIFDRLRPTPTSAHQVQLDTYKVSQTTSESLATTFHQDLLSKPRKPTLWEISALDLQISLSDIFTSLNLNLSQTFGSDVLTSKFNSGDSLCEHLVTSFKGLDQTGILAIRVLEMRDQIVCVVLTVNEQLGLTLGSRAWCCVYTLLENLTSPYFAKHHLSEIGTEKLQISLLQDLLEITGIIARYNVMENLYNGLGTGMEIDAKYQKQLVELCVLIFRYFDFAMFVAHGESTEQHDTGYTTLLMQIRRLDEEARGFRILISLDDDEGDESDEMSDEGRIDESDLVEDEDWEQINGVSRSNSEVISGTIIEQTPMIVKIQEFDV